MLADFSTAMRSISSDVTEIDVMVTPNAKVNSVGSVDPWRHRLIIKVQGLPLEGKANMAVIALLEGFFKAPVEIIRGHTDRHKTIVVHLGLDKILGLLMENERLNGCAGKG